MPTLEPGPLLVAEPYFLLGNASDLTSGSPGGDSFPGVLEIAANPAGVKAIAADAPSVFGQSYLLSNSSVTQPTVTQAYLVDRDILALRVETGTFVFGTQIPYQAAPQDQIFVNGLDTWVSRDGIDLGYLAGKNRDTLRTFDRLIGQDLDLAWADNPLNYVIRSDSDPNYITGVTPENLFRKSKPVDMGNTALFKQEFSVAHTLYLDLPQDLLPGTTYAVDFVGDSLQDFTFVFDPLNSISEAVHVTQVGFRPDDPVKQGYLSTWLGDGGALDYGAGRTFQLVEDSTSAVVYAGEVILTKSAETKDVIGQKNFSLTNLYSLDFSDFSQPGTYRIAVEGVGSSLPFTIGDRTWSDAFYTSARGFYYQRSGIALEPEFSGLSRPRAFHPEDGVVVYQSTAKLMDFQLNFEAGIDDTFKALVAGATDEVLPNAWGGYYDAGDWDRRADHLISSRSFIELAELYPSFYNEYSLNIPESGNALPDVIDEALWGIDLFKRLQKPDGGIPGGIESAEHPRSGETSWQESLTVYAYAPEVWASYLYAATAAQAAHWLSRNGFEEQGQDYLNSALAAMTYAEQEFAAASGSPYTEVFDARNLAALQLFRATGNGAWHELFLATTGFVNPGAQLFQFQAYNQREAAFLYARMEFEGQDLSVKQNALNAIVLEASEAISFSQGNSFNWTQKNAFSPVVWGGGLGSTKVQTILQAHWLTGNAVFLEYGILGTQVAFGANPENTTYTTGLGLRQPANPLLINDRILGEKPTPGITLYGPNDIEALGQFFLLDDTADLIFPQIQDWPTLESYLDLYLFVPGSEFTIHQTMTPTSYALGYLAARQDVGQEAGGLERVLAFLQGADVSLNPRDGANSGGSGNNGPLTPPPLARENFYTALPGQPLVVSSADGVLNGDVNAPGGEIQIDLVDIPSAGGGILLNQDGSFTYFAPPGFVGTDSFSYILSDRQGNRSNVAQVFIQVMAAGNPIASDNVYRATLGTPLTVAAENGVLTNDLNPNGRPFRIDWVDPPSAGGGILLAQDGSFVYIPSPSFRGVESFSYVLTDDEGRRSNVARVSFLVELPPGLLEVSPVGQEFDAAATFAEWRGALK